VNKKVTESHVNQVVRKAWELYFQWAKSKTHIDFILYEGQRRLAVRAIESAPNPETLKIWRDQFQLPD
jgi:hypothetical protein